MHTMIRWSLKFLFVPPVFLIPPNTSSLFIFKHSKLTTCLLNTYPRIRSSCFGKCKILRILSNDPYRNGMRLNFYPDRQLFIITSFFPPAFSSHLERTQPSVHLLFEPYCISSRNLTHHYRIPRIHGRLYERKT